jgi:hypothetical protein
MTVTCSSIILYLFHHLFSFSSKIKQTSVPVFAYDGVRLMKQAVSCMNIKIYLFRSSFYDAVIMWTIQSRMV